MKSLKENISLKKYNTFGIDATARWFSSFSTLEELRSLLSFTESNPTESGLGKSAPSARGAKYLLLGGGSNLLFTHDFDGLVLKNEILGIELIREDAKYVYVRAGAGESWHGFVQYCLQRNWAGVENLSLIPGNVGAAPMQNIGAYGVEIKDVFYELEALDTRTDKVLAFSLNDCQFGYRDSIFKRGFRDRAIILNVIFRLHKIPHFHTEYGAIRAELDKMGVQKLSIQAISQAIINIRSSKLPDPRQIGNAGSFFKNPTVSGDRFAALQREFPGIPGYPSVNPGISALTDSSTPSGTPPSPDQNPSLPTSSGNPGAPILPGSSTSSGAPAPPTLSGIPGEPLPPVKLAAGWLIEQCGWKGYRRGDAGCHALQALVLVNYGHASGQEIYDLSEEILQSVKTRFGVELEREVNIIA